MTRWTPEMDARAVRCLAAAETQWSAWEEWRAPGGAAAEVGYEAFRARARRLRDRQPPANDVVANDVQPAEPQRLQRVLFVPDSHWPLVDRVAWNVMILAAQALRPDVIVVLGDYLDNAALSSHPRTSLDGESSTTAEVKASLDGLNQLDALGATRKVYCEGNHEFRLQRETAQKLPALYGAVTIQGLLGLAERGWEWHAYHNKARVGNMVVSHDIGNSGQNAHKTAMDVAGGPIAIGHTHAMGVAYRGDAFGRHKFGAVFGHLASIAALKHYMSEVKVEHFHQLGFGTGTIAPDGEVFVQCHPILVDSEGYRTVVDGQLYQRRTQHPRGAA